LGETDRPISVPDEAVVWSSERQGVLGAGPSLPLNILQPGLHVITLTATDRGGHASALSTTSSLARARYVPVSMKQREIRDIRPQSYEG
jgi:hypothetical protein